jgi:hypothetical protein
MSLSDFIPAKFINLFEDPDFSKAIKGYNLYLLKEDKEYRAEVKTYFEECLITSELRPVQRLSTAETLLGINDFSDFEDDHEPTIPNRLEKLERETEKKVFNITDLPAMPETITDIRTDFLIKHLETNEETPKIPSPFDNMELPFCNSKEFRYFVDNVLPGKYKPRSLKNIRKLKKDIFENAVARYKDLVSIEKSFHGNRELRLVMPKQISMSKVGIGVTG